MVDSSSPHSIDSSGLRDLSSANLLRAVVLLVAVAALCLCYGFVGGLTAVWFLVMAFGLMLGPIAAGCEPYKAALQGVVISLLFVALCDFGLRLFARRVELLGLIAAKTTEVNFSAGSYSYSTVTELNNGLFTMVAGSVTVSVLVRNVLRVRGDSPSLIEYRKLWTVGGKAVTVVAIASVPLIRVAYLKFQNPYEYLAPTMSGDGRNFFLKVQDMRLSLEGLSPKQFLAQSDFLPYVSSVFSRGMGSTGLMDIRDQYAIAGMFALLSVIAVLAFGALVAAAAQIDNLPRAATTSGIHVTVAILGPIAATFPLVVNQISNYGYFSAYGGMAFGVCAVALFLSSGPGETPYAALIATIFAYLTYPLYVFMVVPCYLVYRAEKGFSQKSVRSLVIIVSGVLVLRPSLMTSIVAKFTSRLQLPGAIRYLGESYQLATIGIFVLMMQSKNCRVSRIGRVGFATTAFFVGAKWLLMTIAPEADSYYFEKLNYALLFLSFFLGLAVLSWFILRLGGLAERQTVSVSYVILVSFAAVTFVGAFFPTNSFFERSSDWIQPRASSVELAVSTWPSTTRVAFDESDPGESRLMNFWMPYFWKQPGWEWSYLVNDISPEGICGMLLQAPAEVVYWSDTLRDGTVALCPEAVLASSGE